MHPVGYEPMLATGGRAPTGDGWAFEIKLDGWRAVVHIGSGQAAVYSRPGRNMTKWVPQLDRLVDAVPSGTVLDAEIVAGSGRSWSFYRLSPHLSTRWGAISFAAFDLLAVGATPCWRRPTRSAVGRCAPWTSWGRRGARCRRGPTSRPTTFWPPASCRAWRDWWPSDWGPGTAPGCAARTGPR